MFLALQSIEETIKYGGAWYGNPVFGVATAAILIVSFIAISAALLGFILNSQAKANEKLLTAIDNLHTSLTTFGADLQEIRASTKQINELNFRLIDTLQKVISQLSERS